MQLEREDQEVAEIELCLVEGKGVLGGEGRSKVIGGIDQRRHGRVYRQGLAQGSERQGRR